MAYSSVTFLVIVLYSVFAQPQLFLDRIRMAPGFQIELYAEVPYARSMALSPNGNVFVASYGFSAPAQPVWILQQPSTCVPGNCVPSRVFPITGPLEMANGVTFMNGALFVGLNDRLLRFDNIERNLSMLVGADTILAGPYLDNNPWHGWRYLSQHNDYLYMTIGSPCNVPNDTDPTCADRTLHPWYGTIVRLEADGSEVIQVAHGIRNSVGMAFDSAGNLWFTDNGRDNMPPDHNNMPPDELNMVPGKAFGNHYGFPFCYGYNLSDPEFNPSGNCAPYVSARQQLDPHVAGLGLRFYEGDMFPSQYQGAIFIAEHGSWDRQPPSGYRVSMVQLNAFKNLNWYGAFADGWLDGSQCSTDDDCPGTATCQNAVDAGYVAPFYCTGWGRPVDILVLRDGSILVSDDQNGVIYRISYIGVWYQTVTFYVLVALLGGFVAGMLVMLAIRRFLDWRRTRHHVSIQETDDSEKPRLVI